MFCRCGCGKITQIANRNCIKRGEKKGDHRNYIHGHNRRGHKHKQESLNLMSIAQTGHPQYPGVGYQKGHTVSPEIRKKISDKNTGRASTRKGVCLSNETRLKISETLRARGIRPKKIFKAFGENHPNWKGGRSTEIKKLRATEEYKIWRCFVYGRDRWTCRECGRKPKTIVAHHIQSFTSYPAVRFDVGNGITLCRSCHKKIHKEIGFTTRFKPRLIHDKDNPRTEVTVRWE